ncbi:phosphorylcholine transferase LicD [Methanobrevibacter sp. DSM 116169]|uniref:LicD family protein n=1 Tax=Methanobrevibacter sp. DSM 116169 TaxID=3242727 RepID=UPI0038FC2545
MHYDDYDKTELNHLHDVQLMILNDFIKICEENNIEYFAYGGTALGAIRHNGFIPWDDDIDVIMLKNEYEKFLDIMKSMKCDKYTILNMDNNEDYFYCFSKMSLNKTEFKQSWTRNTDFSLGINIDVFVLNDVPDNKLKRSIYFWENKILNSILAVYITSLNKNYSSKKIEIISKIGNLLLKIFNINSSLIKKYYRNMVEKSSDKDFKYVFENNAFCYKEPIPKNIFNEIKKVKFESLTLNIPKDYDTYLKIIYGDYMTPPPETDRIVHEHDFIDFGPY